MSHIAEENKPATVTASSPEAPISEAPSVRNQAYEWAWSLWAERQFTFRVTAIGALVGLVLAFAIPSRYTAQTQLMPPDATSPGIAAAIAGSVADKAGGLGTAAADLLGFKSSGALFVGILKSRTVQDRMINRFDLRRVYRTEYWVDARSELAERTDIVEDRKSGIISLSVTDRDRDRAQQMATAYVDELNRVVAISAMSAAGRERQYIEQQMAYVRKEMDESSHALADFSTKTGTVDLKEQARALVDAAATVQGELIAAESELKGLSAIYTDNNVRVRRVRARIDELNRQLHELGGSAASAPGLATEYPNIRQLPQLGVTFEDLYRRNKIADAVYEALVQQYELSKLEEAKDTPKVQMLDVPERPELRSFPPRVLIIITCTLLSFVFAALWVFANEAWTSVGEQDAAKRLITEIIVVVAAHRFWRNKYVLAFRNACFRIQKNHWFRRQVPSQGD